MQLNVVNSMGRFFGRIVTDRYLASWEQMGDLTWFAELKHLTFEIASTLLIGSEPGAETTELSRLFTGHETTTSLITSLCLALPQHPAVLATARAEQEQIGIDTVISIDTIKQMTYLDRVLREVERMYPPVGGGFRGVVEEFEFNGYRVPKGWQVLYRIPEAHYDASVYPEPDKFDPDRLEPKASDYNFVTYGGGSRVCIGMAFAQMELKIIAASLLRHYSWELLPNQNLTLDPIPTLHPRDGLKVTFQRLV